MTTQPTLTATLEALSKHIRDTFAEMSFQLTAQVGLGALLRAEPADRSRTRLNHLTDDQLERISTATRELTTLVDGLLEDRETTTNDETNIQPEPESPAATGRPSSLARFGERSL